jgi:hypothetical protein
VSDPARHQKLQRVLGPSVATEIGAVIAGSILTRASSSRPARRRRDNFGACLQAGLRRNCFEARWVALPTRPQEVRRLDQGQESRGARCPARGGGGLESEMTEASPDEPGTCLAARVGAAGTSHDSDGTRRAPVKLTQKECHRCRS